MTKRRPGVRPTRLPPVYDTALGEYAAALERAVPRWASLHGLDQMEPGTRVRSKRCRPCRLVTASVRASGSQQQSVGVV
ncbi:hypothetical protein [Nonomuraea dietziae]|uniref:hypothetical protein n=1 Tax=Nonomuraea dietziae TaxID=65515 RepID=UPI0033FF70B6